MISPDRPLVSFDIETTGSSTQTDRIVEIAMIRRDGAETRNLVLRLNPEMPIHPMAIRVHGITNQDVIGCPTFAQKADEIRSFLHGADLVGFNITGFDLPMLQRHFQEVDPSMTLPVESVGVIDLMVLYHHIAPRNLTAASLQYLGKPLENAHDALADSRCVMDLLPAMVQTESTLPQTMAGLAELTDQILSERKVSEGPDGDYYFRFGKHNGKSFKEVLALEPSYMKWCASQEGMGKRVTELFKTALANHKNRQGG